MIKLQENLSFYENYFYGLQDVFVEHKSAEQVGLGLLKIISGLTGLYMFTGAY